MKTFLVLLSFCCTIYANAQNRMTKDGLRYGKWTETPYMNDPQTKTGNYKIIPLGSIDTTKTMGDNIFVLKYQNAEALLFYDGRAHNEISVKDSIWQYYDSLGSRVHFEEQWINGIMLWRKTYNPKGEITLYNYWDYTDDSSAELQYKEHQLFRKSFCPPKDKNHETTLYYPYENLYISNAEPEFNVNFLDKPSDTFEIKLCAKSPLNILSITSRTSDIHLVDSKFKEIPFPLQMVKGDTFFLKIIYTPKAIYAQDTGKVTIITDEKKSPVYKITSLNHAYHIDGGNVEALSSITISKTKDRYLLIDQIGTETDITVFSSTGIQREWENKKKIDLSDFKTGVYVLTIGGCNLAPGGRMTLTIIK